MRGEVTKRLRMITRLGEGGLRPPKLDYVMVECSLMANIIISWYIFIKCKYLHSGNNPCELSKIWFGYIISDTVKSRTRPKISIKKSGWEKGPLFWQHSKIWPVISLYNTKKLGHPNIHKGSHHNSKTPICWESLPER